MGEARCEAGNTTLPLTQEEFTADRPGKAPLRWRVPVLARTTGAAQVASGLVSGGKAELVLPGCGTVLVNAGQSGYFRTLYSPAQFRALGSGFASLAPIDQLGLMSDSFSLGLAGYQPASDTLDLVMATPADADTQVWGWIAEGFTTLEDYDPRQSPLRQRLRRVGNARDVSVANDGP